MNICLLFRDTGPKRWTGGPSRAIPELAVALTEEGHRVALLTESPDVELDRLGGVSVRVTPVPSAPIPWGDLAPETARHNLTCAAAAYREVRAIHEREWPVDVLLTTLHRSEGALCLLDSRFPTIVTCNTSMRTTSDLDPAYRALEDLDSCLALEGAALARSEYLHGLTEAVLEKTLTDYRLSPSFTAVVGRGIRDRGWVPPRAADGHPRILFVGRIEHRKGVDVLLGAAEELFEKGIRANFTLVGRPAESPLREAFERRNRHRPELVSAVRFAGPVSDAELERLFTETDLVCQPARYESHGVVIVEAMMHGRAIVACDAGGIGEVVTDGVNALLVEPENPSALARRLELLLSDGDLRLRLGLAGRKRYEERFEARVVARRMAALMAEVIDLHEPAHLGPEELRTRVAELLVDARVVGETDALLVADELLSGRPAGRPAGNGPGRPLELDGRTEATRQALRRAALADLPRARDRGGARDPRVSAVLMTQSRPELLGRALDSIAEQEGVSSTVLVIDQGSAPEMAAQIAAVCAGRPGVKLHRSEVNLAVPGGRNLGVELTGEELLLFLDDDAELLPGALAHLLDVLDADPGAGAVSATVVTPDGLISHSGGWFEIGPSAVTFALNGFGEPFTSAALAPTGAADWVGGTAFLVRRTLLEEFPFDPEMGAYYEDNEWAYRISLSRPGCMRRSREALALHYLAGRQVGVLERFDARRRVAHLASCARFYERHGLLLGPFAWELLPDRVAVDGDLGLGDVRLLMELITAKGEEWTLTAWEAGELENLLQANKLREQVERTHPELEVLRPEVPRLNEIVAQQRDTMSWLFEREATLRMIEAGGWWRLRGRLQAPLRMAERLRGLIRERLG